MNDSLPPALVWPWRALAAVIGAAHTAVHLPFTNDDALISASFARAFAAGSPLGTYVPGEPLVAGFSNPTWTVLLAAGEMLGIDAMTTADAVALALSATSAALLAGVILRAARRPWHRWVSVLPATSPIAAMWSASGLETSIVLFLLAATAVLLQREVRATRWWHHVPSACTVLLLSLSRPEGFLFAAAATAIKSYDVLRRRSRVPRWTLVPWLAVACGGLGTWLLWSSARFGDPLPNTVYAKPSARSWAQIVADAFDPHSVTWTAAARFLADSGTLFVAPFILVGCLAAVRLHHPRLVVMATTAAVLPMTQLDWMADHRFYAVLAPFLLTLAAIGVVAVTDFAARSGTLRRPVVLASVLAAGMALWAGATTSLDERDAEYADQVTGESVNDLYAPLESAAQEIGLVNPLYFAPDAGATTYELRWRLLDSAGLLDPVISHAMPNPTRAWAYVFHGRRPDILHTHGHWSRVWRLTPEVARDFGYVELPAGTGSGHDFVRRDALVRTSTTMSPSVLGWTETVEAGSDIVVRVLVPGRLDSGDIRAEVRNDAGVAATATAPIGLGLGLDLADDEAMVHTLRLPTSGPSTLDLTVEVHGHRVHDSTVMVTDDRPVELLTLGGDLTAARDRWVMWAAAHGASHSAAASSARSRAALEAAERALNALSRRSVDDAHAWMHLATQIRGQEEPGRAWVALAQRALDLGPEGAVIALAADPMSVDAVRNVRRYWLEPSDELDTLLGR